MGLVGSGGAVISGGDSGSGVGTSSFLISGFLSSSSSFSKTSIVKYNWLFGFIKSNHIFISPSVTSSDPTIPLYLSTIFSNTSLCFKKSSLTPSLFREGSRTCHCGRSVSILKIASFTAGIFSFHSITEIFIFLTLF